MIKDYMLKAFDHRLLASKDKVNFDIPRPFFWNMFLKENDKSLLVGFPNENKNFQA